MPLHHRPQPLNFPGPYYSNSYVPEILAEPSGTDPSKGTTSVDIAHYCFYPHSKLLRITYNFHQTNTGNAGDGDYLFTMPSGYQIDMTKVIGLSVDNTVGSVVGSAHVTSTAEVNTIGLGVVQVYDADHLAMTVNDDDGIGPSRVGSAYFNMNPTNMSYSFTAEVPVV